MPTYEFYNTKTDEMEEHRMSYKDLDKFAEDNPHLEKRISSPNIVSKVGSRTDFGKSGGFNEVLSKVADTGLPAIATPTSLFLNRAPIANLYP